MNPILVLGPGRPGAPPLERLQVDLHLTALLDERAVNDCAYSSVFVINDGGADAVRRALLALRLRGRGQLPRVGVVSYLSGASPYGNGNGPPGVTPRASLRGAPGRLVSAEALRLRLERQPRLQIKSNGQVLSFEYQSP